MRGYIVNKRDAFHFKGIKLKTRISQISIGPCGSHVRVPSLSSMVSSWVLPQAGGACLFLPLPAGLIVLACFPWDISFCRDPVLWHTGPTHCSHDARHTPYTLPAALGAHLLRHTACLFLLFLSHAVTRCGVCGGWGG